MYANSLLHFSTPEINERKITIISKEINYARICSNMNITHRNYLYQITRLNISSFCVCIQTYVWFYQRWVHQRLLQRQQWQKQNHIQDWIHRGKIDYTRLGEWSKLMGCRSGTRSSTTTNGRSCGSGNSWSTSEI